MKDFFFRLRLLVLRLIDCLFHLLQFHVFSFKIIADDLKLFLGIAYLRDYLSICNNRRSVIGNVVFIFNYFPVPALFFGLTFRIKG